MNNVRERTTVNDAWIVLSIGDSTDEYGTRPVLFERIFLVESDAIAVASSYGLAFVVPVKQVMGFFARSFVNTDIHD